MPHGAAATPITGCARHRYSDRFTRHATDSHRDAGHAHPQPSAPCPAARRPSPALAAPAPLPPAPRRAGSTPRRGQRAGIAPAADRPGHTPTIRTRASARFRATSIHTAPPSRPHPLRMVRAAACGKPRPAALARGAAQPAAALRALDAGLARFRTGRNAAGIAAVFGGADGVVAHAAPPAARGRHRHDGGHACRALPGAG